MPKRNGVFGVRPRNEKCTAKGPAFPARFRVPAPPESRAIRAVRGRPRGASAEGAPAPSLRARFAQAQQPLLVTPKALQTIAQGREALRAHPGNVGSPPRWPVRR